MKIPRDINGTKLVKALRVLGYERVRQDGSHIRLTTTINGTHHVTVPAHKPLKTGTLLGGVLKPVAAHHRLTVEELLQKLGL
ncbi:MAG: type II toxin-antitoxin system HicA family toxin [Opitutaceae bacterium]|nr:type II toxin-antitoxin system HicA family toxin [Opitutaceae bacterium]